MKNSKGFSLVEVITGTFILGFFMLIMSQILVNSSQNATKDRLKADINYNRNVLQKTARNFSIVYQVIENTMKTETGSDAQFKNFRACFGEKIAGVTAANCAQYSNGWKTVIEIQGFELFNKKWTLRGECASGQECLMTSSAKFFASCKNLTDPSGTLSTRCYSLSFLVAMDTTKIEEKIQQNHPSVSGLTLSQIQFKPIQVSFSGVLFNFDFSYSNQDCTPSFSFIGSINPETRQLVCNPATATASFCNTSVRSFGTGNACVPDTFVSEEHGVKGGFTPQVVDRKFATAGYMTTVFEGELVGNGGTRTFARPKPSPANDPPGASCSDLSDTCTIVIPFFFPDDGDYIKLQCGDLIGNNYEARKADFTTGVNFKIKNIKIPATMYAPQTVYCQYYMLDKDNNLKAYQPMSAEIRIIDSNIGGPPGGQPPTNPGNPGAPVDITSGNL